MSSLIPTIGDFHAIVVMGISGIIFAYFLLRGGSDFISIYNRLLLHYKGYREIRLLHRIRMAHNRELAEISDLVLAKKLDKMI